MKTRSPTLRRSLIGLALVAGGVVLALWLIPSGQYLLLPDKARLVEPLVKIANEETDDAGGAGVYMVDILVRRANVLERIFPGLNEGATLIPDEQINPAGVSDDQRRASNRLDMTRSQEIAAAVALQALGYDVEVEANGAEVSLVLPGSPAEDAGLKPGDVIVEVESRPVATLDDLQRAFDDVRPGAQVEIALQRSGGVSTYSVDTEESEREPGRAVIGVQVQEAASIDLPIDIEIDAGSVGGPSAGLAFALDILDELGTEVDQGRTVVVTGELRLDGSVGEIGGIKQKTIGAQRAGADVFVVPQGNAADAERYAEDRLDILAVSSFEEALAELGVAIA